MADDAPPALAREFHFLAEKWTHLASELERAQLYRPDPPNVFPLERTR